MIIIFYLIEFFALIFMLVTIVMANKQKGFRDNSQITFLLMLIMVTVWTISSIALSSYSKSGILLSIGENGLNWINKLSFVCAILTTQLAVLMIISIIKNSALSKFSREVSIDYYNKYTLRVAVPISLVVSYMYLRLGFAGRIFISDTEYRYIQNDLGIWLMAAVVLFNSATIFYLYHKFNRSGYINKEGLDKVRLMTKGYLLSVVYISFFVIVMPRLISGLANYLYDISTFGPIIFALSCYVAIIKHRLFDIKTSAFRAVGYTIAMGVSILAITMFILWGVLAPITSDWTKYPNETYVITFFSILIVGWLSPKFINMFNRVTYPIFYRNNYNPILFAEHMAEAVTGNPQTTDLQRSILKLFNKAYGAGYIQVIVNQIEDDDPHQSNLVIGESLGHGAPDEVLGFYGRLFFGYEQKHKYILRSKLDFEEGSEENKQLDENNIGMIAKLKLNKRLVGYIVFGEKTSGTLYTPEDVNLVKNHYSEIAVALQNSVRYSRIKQFNLELQEKVDIATAKLKKSNARLRKLDKAKDDFLSIASHQLRTPLTVVRGNISLVAEGTMGKVSPQAHDILVQSERSAGRLADLINDFLSTSRLKTGKFILDPAPMDLGDAVEEEYERLKDFASMRGVDLVMHKIPADLPLIMADASKIRQVLLNTIDNAIYYSPRRSGKVEIMVYSDGKSVIYKVKDNGIGVPAREKHKMFTRMYRAENAKGVRPDGNGLGLFLMKKIIDAHRGIIIFESKEGVGSTFGFKIDINPKVPLERIVIT